MTDLQVFNFQDQPIREANATNAEFLKYADALDRMKRRFGGSGIDYPPKEEGANS